MGLAVAAAFGAAWLIDPDHLVWAPLTAYLVSAHNRGRGDVLWKGTQRLVGALAGAAVATGLVGAFGPADDRAIVAVFVVVALAAALRPFGYVWWAALVTAGLAFLYGYFGQGSELIARRLLGIAVGGVIALAAAWFVGPIKTTDVARRRIGAVQRALAQVADGRRDGRVTPRDVAELRRARDDLRPLVPVARAARRLGVGSVRRLEDDVTAAAERADRLLQAVTRDDASGEASAR